MGALVQVHVIHIDFFIRNGTVELCMKMQPRLLQHAKAVNPHLGRAECMAKGDDTRAGIVVVGLLDDLDRSIICFNDILVFNLAGQSSALVQTFHHSAAVAFHLGQRFGPV